MIKTESLLFIDLYKFSMLRSFFQQFNNVWARYDFKCRNKDIHWTKEMIAEISESIDYVCSLRFQPEELTYIKNLRYMGDDARGFIELLKMYQLNREYFHIKDNGQNFDNLEMWAEGPIWQSSMFEIYILRITNEVYFKHTTNKQTCWEEGTDRLYAKINSIKKDPFIFSDFGVRRCYSGEWNDEVVSILHKNLPKNIFTGTSNVWLAMKYDLIPIGTVAHEYIQLGQALDEVTLSCSQKYMLQKWAELYRGDLGTAISDCLGFDFFLHDFDRYFANLFTGIRHDSGDWKIWGEKAIAHYKKLGIDPKTKTLVFSDGLTVEKAQEINNYFKGQANIVMGIGTSITNDMGVEPLNIVFKMTSANGKPVAKISDSPGKLMCKDETYVNYLKGVIETTLVRR
jgi:nicotinate phosphoribosyltransferase